MVFNSIYTQNQDNIGAVEYSIDSGATWLPVLYMVETADLLMGTDGKVDGYATLAAAHGDAAHLYDPNSGEEIGLHNGAFIGVKSNLWSTLGSYISGRINDDQFESKRVEMYRLDRADNQAKVRFRFAQAGTGSWFFGIDDLGLYEVVKALPPKITEPPQSQIVSAGYEVTLKVAATGDELLYQWKFNGTPIQAPFSATLVLPNVQAANAGEYLVVINNPGGEAVSTPAVLQVFSGPVTQDLVAHLKFDDNLSDSSGKGNHGAAVGAPTFSTGKIGQAVHIPSGADYVTLGTPADLNFGTDTNFSIAFWAETIAWNDDPSYIGNKNCNSGGNQGYVLATDSDGHFQWNLAGAPGSRKDYDGAPGALSNGWHHVVVTFDRTANAATYIDGLLVNSKSMTADKNNVDTPAGMATNLGQDGTGACGPVFTDLNMDDVGIWQRILTPQVVAAIYSAGLTGKDLSTVQVNPPVAQTITLKFVGGTLQLSWTANATLEAADKITGPWAPMAGTSPLTVTPTGTMKFYRTAK